MGTASSSNKGQASRSRFSSWGSSIDETFCGDSALCGDYPEDDLEGFPLVENAPTRRNSVITNPYIDPAPRKPPKLRRALSEGEASVRRAYMTDYSDNSDDPDSDDDYPTQANKIKNARSAVSLPEAVEQDDYPNRPAPLPLAIANGNMPPPSRARPRRKKKKQKPMTSQTRRPFSPSQLQNHSTQKLPKSKKAPTSRYSKFDRQPRPESAYSPPRRYSEPFVPPMSSLSKRRPQSSHSYDLDDDYNYPNYTSHFTDPPKASTKSKKKSNSVPPKKKNDDFLTDYYLPSQVPPEPKYKSSAPLKPIRKTYPSNIEPNYKVPKAKSTRTRKREAPRRQTRKAPDYGVPNYSGAPNNYDSIIQSAPPIRKGARIKAPNGNLGGPTPTPFVVGKYASPKTPYLSST